MQATSLVPSLGEEGKQEASSKTGLSSGDGWGWRPRGRCSVSLPPQRYESPPGSSASLSAGVGGEQFWLLCRLE